MTDSSSSSDEEEKAKLKSAIWQSSSSKINQKDKKTDIKAQPKQSLRRNCDELEEQGDYRNVDAPPQLKSFIAKKLTSWLDSSIQEVDGKALETLSSTTTRDDLDAGFQLFSTSKPGPLMEEEPRPERRRRPPSSSDSDSDEERSKLASVAVSYEQVLQSSQPQTSQDQQVTFNLLPTNNLPVLTSTGPVEPNGASQAHDLNSKKRKPKCSEGGASDEKGGKGCHGNERKKKKHKKKVMEKTCAFKKEAVITDANVQTELKMSQDIKHRLENLPTSTEDTGSENPPQQPIQTLKKNKKRRKKCKMDRFVADKNNDQNNLEASVR